MGRAGAVLGQTMFSVVTVDRTDQLAHGYSEVAIHHHSHDTYMTPSTVPEGLAA
jgi:hypothetical protein